MMLRVPHLLMKNFNKECQLNQLQKLFAIFTVNISKVYNLIFFKGFYLFTVLGNF